MKFLKVLNKDILIDVFFYLHLSIGFLLSSFIALYFEFDHLKVAFIWSLIFIYLLIQKTKRKL